jgi:hypothetical protein
LSCFVGIHGLRHQNCGKNPEPTEETVQAIPDTDDAAKPKKLMSEHSRFIVTAYYEVSLS